MVTVSSPTRSTASSPSSSSAWSHTQHEKLHFVKQLNTNYRYFNDLREKEIITHNIYMYILTADDVATIDLSS